MIRDMLRECYIDHDGQITYDEFVRFCNQTEKELWTLFQSIDRDRSGNLDKSELSQAFERAGVAVSNARLDRFFGYIDKNHDGTIDFPEWRGESLKSIHGPMFAARKISRSLNERCVADLWILLQTSFFLSPLTLQASNKFSPITQLLSS